MIRGLDRVAKSLGISVEPEKTNIQDFTSPEEVPMMYRAQISGRCSLMFAGDKNKHLERWKDEWIYPDSKDLPRYQNQEPSLGLEGGNYRIKVEFPFRLLSNCGQDSILRPVMGKDGIPYLPGSSVKGLFRRACNDTQAKKYCGDDTKLAPGSLGLRFHGAYPVGDWSGMHRVKVRENGVEVTKTRYRMLDVVHPQQERQVGSKKKEGSSKKQNATALAAISLYKPTMIFQFSSADPDIDWKEVETIFWNAVDLGVGGKTSTGYGFGGHNNQRPAVVQQGKATVMLVGQGVSPTLRNGEAEFRPNLFKASLRGHFQRLLAGVMSDQKEIENNVNRLFGGSSGSGAVQLFWEQRSEVKYERFGATQTFEANGILHINALEDEDVNLIEQVLKFAFIMGGLGKSWRRVSHKLFHKTYSKFEIGCHWELPAIERSWLQIKSPDDLKYFLAGIHQEYKTKFGGKQLAPSNWRESWHPNRLSVYATVTTESRAITLFHDEIYKRTPAIGGKDPNDTRPTFFSSVWHRMLPIGDKCFLEIVTLFHAQDEYWQHESKGDQLENFLQSLKDREFSLIWGKQKNTLTPTKKPIVKPRKPGK